MNAIKNIIASTYRAYYLQLVKCFMFINSFKPFINPINELLLSLSSHLTGEETKAHKC